MSACILPIPSSSPQHSNYTPSIGNKLTVPIDGFFDAGMLLQALKANAKLKEAQKEAEVSNAKRSIGKKLRLSEN